MVGITKKKLSISSCNVNDDNGKVSTGDEKFEVMLNPGSYSHNYSISYTKDDSQGKLASEKKFSGIDPEKVKFDIVLDGTGVIPGVTTTVRKQITALNTVIYKYDGNNHQPNHVKIIWGSLIFYCRLTALSCNFTVFDSAGEPLRAKLSLSFEEFMTPQEEALESNNSSPDLTHEITVKAGDTLPLLCYKIYNDCMYYPEVAKINSIDSISQVKPGLKLYFPPLR